MKYSLQNYTEAFIRTGEEISYQKAADGLVKLLKKTGDIKHAKKIIGAIHKKFVNNKDGQWIEIELAREIPDSKLKGLKSKFSAKDYIGFKINSELIAGSRITINSEEELDNSLASKLKKLFI